MSIETHDNKNAQSDGGFERRDIGVAGVLYFFLGLAAVTLVLGFLLVGLYRFLDKRDNAQQAPVNPLVTNVPADTRHIQKDYEENAFPEPRLEKDELEKGRRNQLNKVRLDEEQLLNSYGWADERSKTVRIPIERAMDLVAQRGLPVRPQAGAQTAAAQQKGNKQ
ncbi:MAG: hypothetical protein LAO24_00160 [Acidobacteriia bacterium]|nr:hypothetical protein [Terriglobia bacterium]